MFQTNFALLTFSTGLLRKEPTRGEQGWCSGESACLPPKWPDLIPGLGVIHCMCVEFGVGSNVKQLAPRQLAPDN